MFKRQGWALFLCAIVTWPALAAAQDKGADKGKGQEKKEQTAQKDDAPTGSEAKPEEAKPKAASLPAAQTKSQISPGTYAVRLRDLEGRVNRLKEQIFRSKARLSLLAETVLDRKIAGSRLNIVFKNEMGGSFKLTRAVFLLDGGPIFNKADESGNLANREIIDLFDGPVVPGDHTVSVILSYRGHGYGIFSYLKGYAFKTKSSRTITIAEGKALKLEIVGFEKGGVTTPLEERPDIRYIRNLSDYEVTKKEAAKPTGGE
jgi:hypothetical protein